MFALAGGAGNGVIGLGHGTQGVKGVLAVEAGVFVNGHGESFREDSKTSEG